MTAGQLLSHPASGGACTPVRSAATYQPRALDLFCGAGGATKGLQMAGFHVTGIDNRSQPRYCGDVFIQADALKPPVRLEDFDFIWASPPCQAYSPLRHLTKRKYPEFIEPVREILRRSGRLTIIENVPGAPLIRPFRLCGSGFALGVRRHRHFESKLSMRVENCDHKSQGRPIDLSGTGYRRLGPRLDKAGGNPNKPRSLDEARQAIDIDWMSRAELSQAIPPAYSEFIGRAAIQHIKAVAA